MVTNSIGIYLYIYMSIRFIATFEKKKYIIKYKKYINWSYFLRHIFLNVKKKKNYTK